MGLAQSASTHYSYGTESTKVIRFEPAEKNSHDRRDSNKSFFDVPGTKYALVIGVVLPNETFPLHGAHNDAVRTKEMLISRMGFKESNVTLLSDSPIAGAHTPASTYSNIIGEICKTVARLRSGDLLFFFFSGHGSSSFDGGLEEADLRNEYVVTADKKFIYDNQSKELLIDNLPSKARLFAFFDSCESGTILDLPYEYDCRNQVTIHGNYLDASGNFHSSQPRVSMMCGCLGGVLKKPRQKASQGMHEVKDVVVFSACKDGAICEEVRECNDESKSYSLATQAFWDLIEAGQNYKMYELAREMRKSIPLTFEQIQVISVSHLRLLEYYLETPTAKTIS